MKILVADDHPLYREAVITQIRRLYPEAEVDQVGSFDDILSTARGNAKYDLFLVDFHMPGMMEAGIAKLAAAFPGIPIAVISGTANSEDVRASIRAGARGFVSKTATADHLASTIQLVVAGGTSVPADILSANPSGPSPESGPEWLGRLSPREREVLAAVARGISNKQVGRELNLAEVTVKLHLRAIFRKTGARTRSEVAVLATKAGIG